MIGPEIPLAIDISAYLAAERHPPCQRIEKYTPAWLEDVIPWQYAEQYRQLQQATSVRSARARDI